jgi:transposase
MWYNIYKCYDYMNFCYGNQAMSGFREPEQRREQLVLWSQRLDDAIPMEHPVRHFDCLLRSDAFCESFSQWQADYVLVEGKPPYHPRYLTGLYLYGMMNQIRSSRQLESACYNRLDVIWLMENQHPDHSTMASFVSKHGKRLRGIFRDVLRVSLQAGLVKLDHVSVDGTKIEANAGRGSVHKASTIQEMLSKIDDEIAKLESEWTSNEAREAGLFGQELPWTPSGSGSDKKRLASLKRRQELLEEALAAIERRREEAPGKAPKPISSVTDPDCRVMLDKEGRRKPNFNGQVATDAENGVVVASEVSDDVVDSGQLVPMIAQVESNCGQLPAEASADSQYNTGPAVKTMELSGVVTYMPESGTLSIEKQGNSAEEIALRKALSGAPLSESEWASLPKDSSGHIRRTAFRYDPEADIHRCPAGQILSFYRNNWIKTKEGKVKRKQYGRNPECLTCQYSSICYDKKKSKQGRVVNRDEYEEYRERLRLRMDSDTARERYRLRRQTVEPRIGEIKQIRAFRRFMRRSLEAVKTEWSMACTSINIGILLRHWNEVAVVL